MKNKFKINAFQWLKTVQTIALMLMASLSVAAAGQETLSLKLKNIPLREAFTQIEEQGGYVFLVAGDAKPALDRKVDVTVESGLITDILEAVLADTGLDYKVVGKQISIFLKEETVSVELATPAIELQQPAKKTVTGTVVDATGEPLIGANVVEKGTANGNITDQGGKFTLTVGNNAVLQVSYVGFVTQEVYVGSLTTLTVTLSENTEALEEVVVVGYGTQKKANLTGAVSTVKNDKITVAPVTSIANTLAGQLPGLISRQASGTPGSDQADLSIRGFGSALVIVDGVEASMNQLDPSQVESVTILKDGSAAIYGARAGNGVILVTTKRGIESKPVITLNATTTLQGSTRILPATNSWQRAQYQRESYLNQGLPPELAPYTLEEIEKFKNGTDPNYGNYDWFNAVMRPWAPMQNHNLSIRGGSDKIRYYGYLGYNNQETIVKTNGGHYTRYNLQSNIDAKITDRLKASIDISYNNYQNYFPAIDGINHTNFWQCIYESDPRYPTHLPDPDKLSYGGSPRGSAVFMTNTELSGYNNNDNNYLRLTGSFTYDFKFLKGLQAKALFNYKYWNGYTKQFIKQRDFYYYDFENDTYSFAKSSIDPTALNISSSWSDEVTQQYFLAYNNVFNHDHNFSAQVILESISNYSTGTSAHGGDFQTTAVEQFSAAGAGTYNATSSEAEMGRISYIGRVNYNYKSRYLFEVILRADASAKFDPEYRWGYFPDVSAAWDISQEKFMDRFKNLDQLKVRASYGQTGYDNIGSFQYMSVYGFDGQYIIGDETIKGIYATRDANPAFTWETMTVSNLGLDFSLFNRKLYGTGEVFYRLREGRLGTRSNSIPSTYGTSLPIENLNSSANRGFELQVGTSGKVAGLYYDVSGNIAWSRSKWVKYDEPEYEDADQKRIYSRNGRWEDIDYGYVSDGLFTSQEEIDALPFIYKSLNGNSTLRPGDIKYKNLNGDNVLDWRDQTILAAGSQPHWTYGFNTYFKYGNIDLSMLFQGAFDYVTWCYLEPSTTEFAFNQRWTEENNDRYAIVPRLGSKGANGLSSDYYTHNTTYIRLKNMALGYEIPATITRKAGISNARIYVAGTNLLTFSSIDKYGYDPELTSGDPRYYYPQQRTLSVGLNVSF